MRIDSATATVHIDSALATRSPAQSSFSCLLCLGGLVNALGGFRANAANLRIYARELRKRGAAWRAAARRLCCVPDCGGAQRAGGAQRVKLGGARRPSRDIDDSSTTYAAKHALGDMEAEAGKKMEDLQVKLKAALDERAKWICELKAAREKQKAAGSAEEEFKAKAEASEAKEAAAKEKAAELDAKNDELRAEIAKLIGHQNHKQKIQHTMRIKEENDALKKMHDAACDEVTNQRLLVERLTAQLERQAGAPLLKDADTPLDFNAIVSEELKLKEELSKAEAKHASLQTVVSTLLGDVASMAGVSTVVAAAPAADAASVEAERQRLVSQLKKQRSSEAAAVEDAKFELSIAVKEKDHAVSKATLGRRHRGLGKQRSAEDLNAQAPAAAL